MKQPLKQPAHDGASVQQQQRQLQQAAPPRSQLLQPGPTLSPPKVRIPGAPAQKRGHSPSKLNRLRPICQLVLAAVGHLLPAPPQRAGPQNEHPQQLLQAPAAAAATKAAVLATGEGHSERSLVALRRQLLPYRRGTLREKFYGAEATAAALPVAAAMPLRYPTACCAQSRDAAVDAQRPS
ncbi:hypothetical protein Efla_002519 [Eimeria flavescens]